MFYSELFEELFIPFVSELSHVVSYNDLRQSIPTNYALPCEFLYFLGHDCCQSFFYPFGEVVGNKEKFDLTFSN